MGLLSASRVALAKKKYKHYFLLSNPQAKLYPHIELICNALQKIIDGEQHYYIIEMPPRHGKSMSITKTFASYYLMKYPDNDVMITTYSQSLQIDFANDERRKFAQWAPILYNLQIGMNKSDRFTIQDHTGNFLATSILGGATGKGADLLIIDDPIKDAEQASSPTIRDKIWDEWTQTFSTRLQKGSSAIVIMTRWQQDDLAGRLLKQSALPWEEIKLPAIAELAPGETDAIGRKDGDALCPDLIPLEQLKRQRHDMGTQRFTALYQQSPTVEGGNIFKREWIKYYVPDRATMVRLGLTEKDVKIAPLHWDEVAQSWDATFKDGDSSDYVAGQTWARRGADFYLRPHWVHDRLSFTDTLSAIREMNRTYPDARAKYIEDKANGSAIIDTLRREITGIIPITPDGGKIVRAGAVSPIWEAGNVYLPHPLWIKQVEELIEEIVNFPNAPHDDYVDAMTQGLNYMNKHKKALNRFGHRRF